MCGKETNNFFCFIITIITSLLVAAGISAVFYSGLITSITTLIYITLVLGILGILYVIFNLICRNRSFCHCIKNSCILPISIGAIITSVFALTITSLATFSISVAILIGALAFFFVSIIIELINLIIDKLCNNKCSD